MDNVGYHRKYRPVGLAGYIGNKKLKETAMLALAQENKPQVILLHGASGCGKTTFARILAREYSCENRGEMGACGECAYCRTLDNYIVTGDTGALVNVREVDVTEASGKNDVSDILADMELPSYGDVWKVYIFDEVHMASHGLQNRFLKIVEEPPARVLIIFCTTNPEKLLDTLRNRCQLSLNVIKPKVNELAGLLRHVCECEGVEWDRDGLEFLCNRADLTIRTALMNLNQVVTERGNARYEDVIKVFEGVSKTLIYEFFRAWKNGNVQRFVSLVHEIRGKVPLPVFLNDLRGFVLKGIYLLNGVRVEGVSDNEVGVIRDLFADLGVEPICNIVDGLSRLNDKNLELDIIALGYRGVHRGVSDVVSAGVELLKGELKAETAEVAAVHMREDEVRKNSGAEVAVNLTRPVNISEIANLFGGISEVKK